MNILEQALAGIAETFGVGIAVVLLVLGVVVLLFGRRLFWAFGGLLGFVFGLGIAPTLLAGIEADVRPFFIFGLAVVFAVVAAGLQRAVLQIAGGVSFALIGWALLAETSDLVRLGATIVLFVAGLLLALRLSDWAALIASALLGAIAIINVLVSAVALPAGLPIILFLVLAGFGIYRQARDLAKG